MLVKYNDDSWLPILKELLESGATDEEIDEARKKFLADPNNERAPEELSNTEE